MTIESAKKLAVAGLVSSLAFATALPSIAQTGNTQPAAAPSSTVQAMTRDMRASQIIDKKVVNPKGEDLGKIEDLIIDANSERVYYALVTFGGFMGVGDKQFVFPVRSFSIGRSGEQLVLDVDKDRLKDAPGFDPGQRPNFSSNTFFANVDRFYKIDAPGRAPGSARMIGAADLIGSDVNDRAQYDIGEIADVVANFGNGRAYVVLETGNDKLVAMPFSAFTIPSRPGVPIQANVDRKKIETARGFDKDKWPDLNSANFRQQVDKQLLSFQVQSKPSPAATQSGRESATGSSR